MKVGDRVCVCVPDSNECVEGKIEAIGRNDVVVIVSGLRQTVPKKWVKPVEQGCGAGLARTRPTLEARSKRTPVCVCLPGAALCVEGDLVKAGKNHSDVSINGVESRIPSAWVRLRALGCLTKTMPGPRSKPAAARAPRPPR